MDDAQNPRDGEITTSDPERIRALAHPLRLRLLEILDDEGAVTATRCAEVTGESVASCSFHLHQLVKYGYVERAEPRGREKPFRAVGRGRNTRYDPDVPESGLAAVAVAGFTLDAEARRIHRWLDAAHLDDDAWNLASLLSRSSFWATAEELAQLSADLMTITDRFTGRWEDPSLRPEGARLAKLFAVVNVEPQADAPTQTEETDR